MRLNPHTKQLTLTSRIEVRDAFERFLKGLNPNWFITFNFGYRIRPLDAHNQMKGFCARLERVALGRNYTKYPNSRRPVAFGFPEHLDVNPHWHCVARMTQALEGALLAEGKEMWLDIASRGELDFSAIRTRNDVVSYCLKRFHILRAPESVFVYSPGHRNH
jgi:hypothetical protein